LERRRLRGDLIEMFKIMTGLDRVDREKLLPLKRIENGREQIKSDL